MQQTYEQTTRQMQARQAFGSTRDLVSLLFRRRAIFLIVFLAITAASAFSLQRQKVVYVAEAKVLVLRGRTPGQPGMDRPWLHWWEEMKSEVEIARSPRVMETAAAKLARAAVEQSQEESTDLAQAPSVPLDADILRDGLGVEPIDETDVIRLSFRAFNRRDAIDGVNAVTEAYIEQSKVVRRDPDAPEIYRGQVEEMQADVDRLTAEIAAYKNKYRITDINVELTELTRQRKAVESTLIDVRAKQHALEIEIEALERRLRDQPEILIPSEDMMVDPQVATYARRLAELDAQLNTLLATYTRDNPQVRAVDRDRQACIASIRNQVEQYIGMKRMTVETYAAEAEAYQDELDRADQRIAELPVHEANLDRLQHELSSAKNSLELIRSDQDVARFRENLDPKFSKLRLLHSASAATRLGGGARQQLFLVASALLALGLSFVAAFMVDTLDHTIKFPNDIEDALGVPVLASIRDVRGVWKPSRMSPRRARV